MTDIETLKARKKELGITFEELAEISGISRTTIITIFHGKNKTFRLDTLQAIEKALKIQKKDNIDISEDEIELLIKYRSLNNTMKKYVLQIIKAIPEQELDRNIIKKENEDDKSRNRKIF